jgi:hypothetical protein
VEFFLQKHENDSVLGCALFLGLLTGSAGPATMVLDCDGVIRAKLFLQGYRDRHPTKDLVNAAKEIK